MIDHDTLSLETSVNYQKLAQQGNATVSVPISATPFDKTITIPHSQGRITSVRVWFDPDTGRRFPATGRQFVDDTTSVQETNFITMKHYITTSNLVLLVDNSSGAAIDFTYWYRIYYDI